MRGSGIYSFSWVGKPVLSIILFYLLTTFTVDLVPTKFLLRMKMPLEALRVHIDRSFVIMQLMSLRHRADCYCTT